MLEEISSGTERSVTVIAREIHHTISETVGDADYSQLLRDLRECSPNDVIMLHINTLGGSLDTSIEIINAIQQSQATVVGISEGAVLSAGSLIFFACHAFIIQPMSYFMLHDGSSGVIGKMNENLKSAEFSANHLRSIYYKVYSKFFTDEEINKVLEGSDIYLLAEEAEERVKRVMEEEGEQNEQIELELEQGQPTDGTGV